MVGTARTRLSFLAFPAVRSCIGCRNTTWSGFKESDRWDRSESKGERGVRDPAIEDLNEHGIPCARDCLALEGRSGDPFAGPSRSAGQTIDGVPGRTGARRRPRVGRPPARASRRERSVDSPAVRAEVDFHDILDGLAAAIWPPQPEANGRRASAAQRAEARGREFFLAHRLVRATTKGEAS